MISDETFDALRYFDIGLAALLAAALAISFVWEYLGRRRLLVLGSTFSWFFLDVASLLTSVVRLGEPGDGRLPLRLIGHVAGVLILAVALSMVSRGEDPVA